MVADKPLQVSVTSNASAKGQKAIAKLLTELADGRLAEQTAARRILSKAQDNAASRPTPQARMVASGMMARRGVVIGFGSRRVFGSGTDGVKLGFLAYGSEFGSSTHRQFGPRNESGYWLHPAAEQNPEMDRVLEDHVDKAIDSAIRVSKVGV